MSRTNGTGSRRPAPIAGPFGLQPLPDYLLLAIAAIVALYVGTAEGAQRAFHRTVGSEQPVPNPISAPGASSLRQEPVLQQGAT